MPFIRQSRDKRGFEYTYVMHTYHPNGTHAQRPRLLYLFRSPGSVKLGRNALDPEVMEALEHTHPDLSFDWQVLTRDATVTRAENSNDRQAQQPQQQQRRRPDNRNQGQGSDRAESRSGPGSGARAQTVREPQGNREFGDVRDDSVLAQVLGAGEAGRMRRRYAELLQRIVRRARTPEDRDRLTERLKRLNPEDWTDEAAVRANAPGADAGWNAISGELPSRRRGRRGGRNRGEGAERPSVIMEPSAEAANEDETTDLPGTGTDGGRRDAVGADAAGSSVAADSDQEAPTDPDVPVGD